MQASAVFTLTTSQVSDNTSSVVVLPVIHLSAVNATLATQHSRYSGSCGYVEKKNSGSGLAWPVHQSWQGEAAGEMHEQMTFRPGQSVVKERNFFPLSFCNRSLTPSEPPPNISTPTPSPFPTCAHRPSPHQHARGDSHPTIAPGRSGCPDARHAGESRIGTKATDSFSALYIIFFGERGPAPAQQRPNTDCPAHPAQGPAVPA